MKLGYDLTIKQTQKLALTPELIQAIQILQFSNQDLESYVQGVLPYEMSGSWPLEALKERSLQRSLNFPILSV